MGKTAADSIVVISRINCSIGRRRRVGCVFLDSIGPACDYYYTQILFSAEPGIIAAVYRKLMCDKLHHTSTSFFKKLPSAVGRPASAIPGKAYHKFVFIDSDKTRTGRTDTHHRIIVFLFKFHTGKIRYPI